MTSYRKKNAIIGLAVATTLGVAVVGLPALATHTTGFRPSAISVGVFGPFDVKADKDGKWDLSIKSKGQTDVRVTSVVFAPGASSNWHSHPGPNLLTVKRGSVTEYEGSNPVCPHTTYNVGDTFGDNGGDAVHLVVNNGSVEAEVIAVAFYPHGVTPITATKPRPTNCTAIGAPEH